VQAEMGREMTHQIVGLGEILWDVFPDGPRFGGAPANAACSAAELGGDAARVVMVSGVGEDPLGDEALASLQTHGVDLAGVQRNRWSTGRVDVTVDAAGIASYRFAEDSAWDHLVWDDTLAQLAADTSAVCFGTLGQRHSDTRAVIRRFVETVPGTALRVLDVNLRPPYDDDQLILESLSLCNVVKLNDEELPRVARLCGCRGEAIDVMRALAERYQLKAVALTRSAHGAVLLRGKQFSDGAGKPVVVADTVGAGDAYAAALMLGLLADRDVAEINAWAIEVASHACRVAGGTMPFPVDLHFRA
jgi:fructokinase